VFCGDGALSVETCVSAKNSPPRCQQCDRIKTSSVIEALKAVKDGSEDVGGLMGLTDCNADLNPYILNPPRGKWIAKVDSEPLWITREPRL
jgi:hypothetical protein